MHAAVSSVLYLRYIFNWSYGRMVVWSLSVSMMERLDSIALSHNDIDFAFIFLRKFVTSVTPFTSNSVDKCFTDIASSA